MSTTTAEPASPTMKKISSTRIPRINNPIILESLGKRSVRTSVRIRKEFVKQPQVKRFGPLMASSRNGNARACLLAILATERAARMGRRHIQRSQLSCSSRRR
jgi:hypothetical protein